MTPLSKIASRNELKCSDAVDGMEDNDNEEGGTLFQSFHGASRNFIQDDILSAANAFTAKGAEEYLDESLHQSPPSSNVHGAAINESSRGHVEDHEEEELAQPILLK